MDKPSRAAHQTKQYLRRPKTWVFQHIHCMLLPPVTGLLASKCLICSLLNKAVSFAFSCQTAPKLSSVTAATDGVWLKPARQKTLPFRRLESSAFGQFNPTCDSPPANSLIFVFIVSLILFWRGRNRLPLNGETRPLIGGIGPPTGTVAQQILGISNRIGKTADTATRFSNFLGLRPQFAML